MVKRVKNVSSDSRSKVLIVDDVVDNLFIMERILKSLKTNVVKAQSGKEALEILQDPNFSLILMDVSMPEMNGYDLVTKIKENPKTKNIPVIFLTAISKEDKLVFRGYEVGAVDYIFKPIDVNILRSKVKVFLTLHEQKQTMEKLLGFLKAKNTELERFNYTVSHDLNSPLMTIEMFVDILARDAKEGNLEGVDKSMERIQFSIGKMHRLLTDLLELSRIGRVVHDFEPIDMGQLAREVSSLLEGRLAKKKVHVTVKDGMPTIKGDRTRLSQVLQNLIDNAAKFIGSQENPEIEIGGTDNEGKCLFFVRDNGLGIEEKYLDYVFGIFEKLNPKAEGTGVGLSMVKRIVETHGGKIWVDSEGIDTGCTFWFTIPREEAQN